MKMDVLATLQKLPEKCVIGPTEAKTLAIDVGYAIHRGIPGYTPVPSLNDEMAERFNKEWSVTPAQKEAMMIGSMFGWHVPGADPDNYDNVAKPKKELVVT